MFLMSLLIDRVLFYLFILVWAVLGLYCCSLAFSSCGKPALPSSCTAVASLVEHGLKGMQASAVAARGFSSCGTWASLPCGQMGSYFLDWELKP